MKNLTVITMSKNTAEAFQEQLHYLLGNQVNVHCYCLENGPANPSESDIILFSSQQAYDREQPYIKSVCPILIARRSINYHELNKLFEIPAGTDVLLVNDLPSSAQQTIALLQTLGINHINYYPYAPDIESYPQLDIAVTPGESQLVPDFVHTVVDIKNRLIDITTLVELLLELGLLDVYAEFLSANYLRDIIHLIESSRQMMRFSDKMKVQQRTIINTVHEGVIATDESKSITVCNQFAGELLQIDEKAAIGCQLGQVVPENVLRRIHNKAKGKDILLNLQKRQVLVNYARLYPEKKKSGTVYTLKDVSEIRRLEELARRKMIEEQKIARYTLAEIVGDSDIIKNTLVIAQKMARADSTILIQGESGTGKELIAQGIHNASARRNGPFIAVNFVAITESLLESELFGYVEGAFTGASRGGNIGLFEQAHKGTIFLDEIGDAPLSFQVKLLRVLQERQIRRVGSSKVIPLDIRVIAATNRNLKTMIAQGKFRQDLYYRLNVLPIKMPPLRERNRDVLLLAKDFYNKQSLSTTIPADVYFAKIAPYFFGYTWPGNIRELQNVVEYMLCICPDTVPGPELLPEDIRCGAKPFVPKDALKQKAYDLIKRANRQGRSIGRRSLASQMGLPESKIRLLLQDMIAQETICSCLGRGGLKIKNTK